MTNRPIILHGESQGWTPVQLSKWSRPARGMPRWWSRIGELPYTPFESREGQAPALRRA